MLVDLVLTEKCFQLAVLFEYNSANIPAFTKVGLFPSCSHVFYPGH